MKRTRKSSWYVLVACSLLFAITGTLIAAGAVMYSGHLVVWAWSIVLSVTCYVLAGRAICEMERC